MLTKEQKKRLAKEARRLALKIAANGPPGTLDAGDWCGCGIGHVLQAGGFVPSVYREQEYMLIDRHAAPTMEYGAFCDLAQALDRNGLVSQATAREGLGEKGSLVFPLLAFADALEESAHK